MISVNDLDPLHDEGVSYYNKLRAGNVFADIRVVLGSTHDADLLFRQFVPDLFDNLITDIRRFVTVGITLDSTEENVTDTEKGKIADKEGDSEICKGKAWEHDVADV